MNSVAPKPLTSRKSRNLSGTAKVPGDKSISHRSIMLAGVALGESRIIGLLEGEDVLNTAAAMRQMGAEIKRQDDGSWIVYGQGVGALAEPANILDMGNSGTSARLLMGLIASHPITAIVTGDDSLRRRPMQRVMTPLEQMGARFDARDGDRMPLTIRGTGEPMPIIYETPVPSAQVKSAILLAGLNTPGTTTVIEREATRDHSERMLRYFGADVRSRQTERGNEITIQGQPELRGKNIAVPADPSSAAFPVVAALLCESSDIFLPAISTNPGRTGLYITLKEMGADITFENERDLNGEPVADLRLRHSELKGIDVPATRAPSMIDEYPVLAVAAAFANGTTRMNGLKELRVKESDRLTLMANGLKSCGVTVEIDGDDLIVHGAKNIAGGATIQTHLDHRIAMSFLVLGLASEQPIQIDDGNCILTSFPNFTELMTGLGASILTS